MAVSVSHVTGEDSERVRISSRDASSCRTEESWRKEAHAQLEASEKEQFRVTTRMAFGSPAKAIVNYARDNGINLIVMGAVSRIYFLEA